MRVRGLLVWLVLSLGCLTSFEDASAQAPAAAAPAANETAAREAFQRGRIHYDNGEFDRAAKAFEEAYALSGRDALLYNLYLAYRDANQQDQAADALRKYLTRVEVIENRPQLEARLKALEEGIAQRNAAAAQQAEQEQLAEQQASQPETQPAPTGPQNDAGAQPSGRWWLMPAIVTGAGGALMIASIATGSMASSKQKELEDKCEGGVCDPSLRSTADSGKTLAVVTDALLFGGAAVAATGVVLFFLKRPKSGEAASAQTEPGASASFVCTSRLCGASARLRF